MLISLIFIQMMLYHDVALDAHLQLIVIIMLVVPRSSVVLLRSVVACVSSVCAKSDGSGIFGIPRSQVSRTGRAKVNLFMRKNPHENAF